MAVATQARPRPGGGRLFIIVGLILALAAGGGVFLFASTLATGAGSGPSQDAVVAKQTISVRHQITADDLSLVKVSTNVINTYAKATDVVGLIAEIQISKGAVILSDMLAKDISLVPAGQAPAYLPLPQGWVAMTIPTGEQQGVAGHIALGDYITVIASASVTLFLPSTGQQVGPPKVLSKTVFTNVHVIGLGPAAANIQPAGSAGTTTGGVTSGITSSLTIELSQCDAEFFTWLLQNMSLRYTLESFHDYLLQPNTACPVITDALGVTQTQVDSRWHFSTL